MIGIREPKKSDIIKFPTEIVSAEVKIDSAGLITAFGQACAYRLFSHTVSPTSSYRPTLPKTISLDWIRWRGSSVWA